MDLLSQRYASPCFFLNGVISTGRLLEFVEDMVEIINSEKEETALWEYYLHRAPFFEGSFNDFKKEIKNNEEHQNMSERTIETTLQHSMNILNKFNPEKGGE
jgi:hypothetical protein